MNSVVDWVVIGRFGRPHGLKGFVSVHSFTYPRENILGYQNWYAFINNQWQALTLLQIEARSKTLIVQVQGFSDRDTAAELTNVDIAIRNEDLPVLGPDEYYWHDLIGMTVINQKGQLFGKVLEVIATGSNDVLVIEGEKRYLIPYLPGQFILEINKDLGQITVDWDMDF